MGPPGSNWSRRACRSSTAARLDTPVRNGEHVGRVLHKGAAMAATGGSWKTMASGAAEEKISQGVQRGQGSVLIRLTQLIDDGRARGTQVQRRAGHGHGAYTTCEQRTGKGKGETVS